MTAEVPTNQNSDMLRLLLVCLLSFVLYTSRVIFLLLHHASSEKGALYLLQYAYKVQ